MDEFPFCLCGCGQRVSKKGNIFINGHNWKGRNLSDETIEKIRSKRLGKNNPFFGKKHTKETKDRLSEIRKGKVSHRKGKKLPEKVIEKIRKAHIKNGKQAWKKNYYLNDIPIYDSYHYKLTVEEKPKRDENDENILTVICTNCKKRFIPKLSSVQERVRCLNNSSGCESRLYCSDECKNLCSIYRKVSLQENHPKKLIYTDEEYKTFREYVLERDEYKCQYCGKKAEYVHHERPQKLEPFFALDPDYAWSVCKECHYKYGHKDECSTGNLAKIIC